MIKRNTVVTTIQTNVNSTVSNIKLATEAGIFKKCFWNDHGFVLEECMKIQMYSLRHLWSVNWSTAHWFQQPMRKEIYRVPRNYVISYNERSHRVVQSKIIFFYIQVVYTKTVQFVNQPKKNPERRCVKCGMIFRRYTIFPTPSETEHSWLLAFHFRQCLKPWMPWFFYGRSNRWCSRSTSIEYTESKT